MAKKENAPVVLTPENIIDQRKAGNILTPELKKMMDDKNKKEKDERIVRETNARVTHIGYKFDTGLINLKKMRSMEQLALYNTRQQGRLQRFITGFTVTDIIMNEYAKTVDDVLKLEKVDDEKTPTCLILLVPEENEKGVIVRKEKRFKIGDVVPAIIDFNDFDDGLEKLDTNLRERQKEIDKQFEEDMVVIKKAAGEYWRSDWMYNIRVVDGCGLKSRSSY